MYKFSRQWDTIYFLGVGSVLLVPDKEKGFAEPRVAGQAIIADPALFAYIHLEYGNTYYNGGHHRHLYAQLGE